MSYLSAAIISYCSLYLVAIIINWSDTLKEDGGGRGNRRQDAAGSQWQPLRKWDKTQCRAWLPGPRRRGSGAIIRLMPQLNSCTSISTVVQLVAGTTTRDLWSLAAATDDDDDDYDDDVVFANSVWCKWHNISFTCLSRPWRLLSED